MCPITFMKFMSNNFTTFYFTFVYVVYLCGWMHKTYEVLYYSNRSTCSRQIDKKTSAMAVNGITKVPTYYAVGLQC